MISTSVTNQAHEHNIITDFRRFLRLVPRTRFGIFQVISECGRISAIKLVKFSDLAGGRALHCHQKLKKIAEWQLGIFFDFWQCAVHCRQTSKKLLINNENFTFFLVLGSVLCCLCTAAKTRTNMLWKDWAEKSLKICFCLHIFVSRFTVDRLYRLYGLYLEQQPEGDYEREIRSFGHMRKTRWAMVGK